LPAVAGCALQAPRDDSSPAGSEECFVQALTVQRAWGTNERAKQGRKEGSIVQRTNGIFALRCASQRDAKGRDSGTRENLQP